MTTSEILQRLRKEFPNRHVSFSVEVSSYREPASSDPDLQPIEITIYDSQKKSIPCTDLEDGIKRLKLRLGMVTAEMEIEI